MAMHVHCDGEGCTAHAATEALSAAMPLSPMSGLPAGWRTVSWLEEPGAEESELEARRAAQIRQRLGPDESLAQVPHLNVRRSTLCPDCGAKIAAASSVVGQVPQFPPGMMEGPFGALVQS